MTLTDIVAKKIITKLIRGEDYRIEIITLINASFLQYAIDFFKKVIEAKLRSENVTVDWYKKEFLDSSLDKNDIAINSGLNMKTISNMYNSGSREIVIEASNEHYDELYSSIKALVENESDVDITLTLKFKGVSVDLNVNESLIVINTLAVKRAQLRGGLWSTAGKRVEKPLMLTLCKLFGVSEQYFKAKIAGKEVDPEVGFEREIDFYLVKDFSEYKCEVKLMGKGNPESADAVIARDSKVFVADKLSETNIRQLNSLNIEWVEMRSKEGYKRFHTVLSNLKIPHSNSPFDIEKKLESILDEVFIY